MVVSILGGVFLGIVLLIAFFGFKILGKKSTTPGAEEMERCSICRGEFPKEKLIIRQVGDYKLLHFCRNCILGLYADPGMKE
ncbi:MAG TPA: hypothetical protein VLY03_01690 [Bacteroidota bacterium]|nr:hypothetical protein [Bacteroidota bacterium]